MSQLGQSENRVPLAPFSHLAHPAARERFQASPSQLTDRSTQTGRQAPPATNWPLLALLRMPWETWAARWPAGEAFPSFSPRMAIQRPLLCCTPRRSLAGRAPVSPASHHPLFQTRAGATACILKHEQSAMPRCDWISAGDCIQLYPWAPSDYNVRLGGKGGRPSVHLIVRGRKGAGLTAYHGLIHV